MGFRTPTWDTPCLIGHLEQAKDVHVQYPGHEDTDTLPSFEKLRHRIDSLSGCRPCASLRHGYHEEAPPCMLSMLCIGTDP